MLATAIAGALAYSVLGATDITWGNVAPETASSGVASAIASGDITWEVAPEDAKGDITWGNAVPADAHGDITWGSGPTTVVGA
ncbi:5'-nucleotidase [Streptomyces sp. NPDC058221]|uniref:5'-nucleotidase n=1 Tax=Streptomyces sp. NPDC058221 TaxID=3346388 RepID=UPI0036EBC52E